MEPNRSRSTGDKDKCGEAIEDQPVDAPEPLTVEQRRRVMQLEQWHLRLRLFGSAVPTTEELFRAAREGHLKMRGKREWRGCNLDWNTGEANCCRRGLRPPHDDCRQWYCPHADLMRTRLLVRLRAAYALERRKVAEQLSLQQAMAE